MVLLIAPAYQDIDGALIFLAGPIQGAAMWQDEAIEYVQKLAPNVHIANPRRSLRYTGDFPAQLYAEQVDWETHHLRRAAQKGVVLFWLAKEAEHDCGRAYAQTTRFELAEWKVRHERGGVQLVVGIEEGFTGARYIRQRFSQDCPNVPLCGSLKETCEAAVRLLKE